jgi:polar amino acid transport system substrate-binding protein/glutamate/aspartate transport system substrate-binding protein
LHAQTIFESISIRHAELVVGDHLFTHELYAIALRRDDVHFRLLADRALTDFYLPDDFLQLLGS